MHDDAGQQVGHAEGPAPGRRRRAGAARRAAQSCNFQTPRTSLATITASRHVVGEAKAVATQPRRDRFNTAVPRYRSETHGWEVVSADPISVSDLCHHRRRHAHQGTGLSVRPGPRPGGAACRLRDHAVARVRADHAPAQAEMDRLSSPATRSPSPIAELGLSVAEMRDRQPGAWIPAPVRGDARAAVRNRRQA
jgi:hypothetical protein